MTGGLANRYQISREGRIYVAALEPNASAVTCPTTGPGLSGTPAQFLIRQTDVTKRLVGLNMKLTQNGTVAGGEVHISVLVDNKDRYNNSGTEISGVALNAFGPGDTSAFEVYHTATLNAKSAPVPVHGDIIAANLGNIYQVDFEDALILEKGSPAKSALIYVWAGTTGPTVSPRFEWTEEP